MGEKNEDSKIGYMIDGEFKEIKLPSLEIDPNLDMGCEPSSEEHKNIFSGGSMNFELDLSGSIEALKKLGVFVDLMHLHLYTNNWRKLHGLPMRRRCK